MRLDNHHQRPCEKHSDRRDDPTPPPPSFDDDTEKKRKKEEKVWSFLTHVFRNEKCEQHISRVEIIIKKRIVPFYISRPPRVFFFHFTTRCDDEGPPFTTTMRATKTITFCTLRNHWTAFPRNLFKIKTLSACFHFHGRSIAIRTINKPHTRAPFMCHIAPLNNSCDRSTRPPALCTSKLVIQKWKKETAQSHKSYLKGRGRGTSIWFIGRKNSDPQELIRIFFSSVGL